MPLQKATHYEILGVKPECSTQDIRSAFLSLSKAHHPDLHANDPSKHKKYVNILEAYTVLSKPELRFNYDSDLQLWASQSIRQNDASSNAPQYTPWKDGSIWEMRDKEQDQFYQEKPYYGFKGVKRMSNTWIAGGAILLMVTGAVCTFLAIKKSSSFTITQLDRRDARVAKHWSDVRNTATQNGNMVQLAILEAKLSEEQD